MSMPCPCSAAVLVQGELARDDEGNRVGATGPAVVGDGAHAVGPGVTLHDLVRRIRHINAVVAISGCYQGAAQAWEQEEEERVWH